MSARLHHHADHRQRSVCVPMHEMHLHRCARAGDGVLARCMEMELQEPEGLARDRQDTAGSVVHLDRVAVVDDFQRRGLVVEDQVRPLGGKGIHDIDRRLHAPVGADGIVW